MVKKESALSDAHVLKTQPCEPLLCLGCGTAPTDCVISFSHACRLVVVPELEQIVTNFCQTD